jgi:hypothetical protein
MWRGVLGRRRCLGKRALDQAGTNKLQLSSITVVRTWLLAANAIRKCVDPTILQSSDVKTLAKRIQYAIEEPMTTTFPPIEVLELIKLTTLVIQVSLRLLRKKCYVCTV